MKLRENQIGLYAELFAEFYSSRKHIEPLDTNLVILSKYSDKRYKDVIDLLSKFSSESLSINTYVNNVKRYINDLHDSINHQFDIFKKQISLIQDTFKPLLFANEQFIGLYGVEQFNEIIDSTRVTYFKNNNGTNKQQDSFPYYIVSELAKNIANDSDEVIRICTTYLNCTFDSNRVLSYPDLSRFSISKNTDSGSFSELGYSPEFFNDTLKKVAETGNHIDLLKRIDVQRTKYKEWYTDINGWINRLLKVNSEKEIKSIVTEHIIPSTNFDHNQYIAFDSLIAILQTVACVTYDMGYKIHTAEIAFNKANLK